MGLRRVRRSLDIPVAKLCQRQGARRHEAAEAVLIGRTATYVRVRQTLIGISVHHPQSKTRNMQTFGPPSRA